MEVSPPTAIPRRILYVITKSNWGGAQRYVYDLAQEAKAEGDKVLVALGGDGELVQRLTQSGISVRSIGGLARDVRLGQEWAAFKEFLALFREKHPDVVHLNSSKAGLAALAARVAGVPHIVFTVHGWAWNERRPLWQKILIVIVYWLTLILCHRVIVVSNAARRQARFLPFVQRRMRVVHNGVHAIEFKSREEARSSLVPHSNRKFWIGTIAELHPIKGLDVLIEAFEHFLPDFSDSELVIIGEGQERGTLERLTQIEGVSGRAHLVGHRSQAATLLPAFDLFVLPSRSEGLAYVLLEAGQASLPVVASKVGGIPEIIEQDATGLLVPYGDRMALTEALKSLARDESLRTKFGTALHAKVEAEFSLSQMVHDTFSLY